ncbi:MAG: phage tail sheath family protein [Bacteroidia bacterium]|nr:phage tail sheath family protein [Bacteroidia bacterium]
MASTLKTPGVYIEEVSLLPPSVAGVNTAIPAFIGYTQKAMIGRESVLYRPVRISSLIEFESYFGSAKPEMMNITLKGDANNPDVTIGFGPTETSGGNGGGGEGGGGGGAAEAPATGSQSRTNAGASPFLMYYSLRMYFDNGGGPCWIVSVGVFDEAQVALMNEELGLEGDDALEAITMVNAADLTAGLNAIKKEDEPTLLVFPDGVNLASASDLYGIYGQALEQCNKLKDRFTLIDLHANNAKGIGGSVLNDANDLRDNLVSDYLKYGAAYYPWLKTSVPFVYDEASVNITDSTGAGGNGGGSVTLGSLKSTNTQRYNLIKARIGQQGVILPPSSAMAGVYARVDRDRGVWKAPANVTLSNVRALTVKINDEENGELNVDPTSGKSINAIRFMTGKGVLVWGARTLAGNDNEWRYVNVRRFYIFAEESTKKASAQFVFEPNDANTWVRVKAMIENFLTDQWRAGALAGANPEAAFYVKVGLGETMTAQDILEGRMNVEIGMAVVRPAEFIILKFSHKMQE